MSTPLDHLERYTPEPNTGCWLWTGPIGAGGYGLGPPPHVLAHRLFWAAFKGPPPKFICHSCDVRMCVNPGHLYSGSHKINMADASRKGRLQKRNWRDRFRGKSKMLTGVPL